MSMGLSGTPEGGLRGHQHRSLLITASAWSGFPTLSLPGDPWEVAAPLPSPCPSAGLAGTLPRAAACCGHHLVQFCIIKLPWLFLLETFTILCLAGNDDCSKPKLGINYTTTLHFSYKGKLCGKSCESTSLLCPPSKAHRGRPRTSRMSSEKDKARKTQQAPAPVWEPLSHWAMSCLPLPKMCEGCER